MNDSGVPFPFLLMGFSGEDRLQFTMVSSHWLRSRLNGDWCIYSGKYDKVWFYFRIWGNTASLCTHRLTWLFGKGMHGHASLVSPRGSRGTNGSYSQFRYPSITYLPLKAAPRRSWRPWPTEAGDGSGRRRATTPAAATCRAPEAVAAGEPLYVAPVPPTAYLDFFSSWVEDRQVRDDGGGDARAVHLRGSLYLRRLYLRSGPGRRGRGERGLHVRSQLHMRGVSHVTVHGALSWAAWVEWAGAA